MPVRLICKTCGKQFLVPPNRATRAKYCSVACSTVAHSSTNHPMWRGGIGKCVDCGKQLASYKAVRCHKCANVKIISQRDYTITEATKQKISNSLKGRKIPDNVRRKLVGRIPWNKGIKMGQPPWNKGKKLPHLSDENSPKWKGGPARCIDCGKLLKDYFPHRCSECWILHNRGENHYKWTGGTDDELIRIRSSQEYKNWRLSVFRRDYFRCVICNHKGRDIEVHHVKTVQQHPDLIFDIDNGVTLCKACHLEIRGSENDYTFMFDDLLNDQKQFRNMVWEDNQGQTLWC